MPITNQKSYQFSCNNRIVNTTEPQNTREAFLLLVNFFAGMAGVVVKGSSDGTTAAMDGVNRITNLASVLRTGVTATTSMSWIVFDVPNMHGTTEIAFGANGIASRIGAAISRTGVFSLAGTPTFFPTAADIVHCGQATTFGGWQIISTAAGDKLVSMGRATDGTNFYLMTAGNNAIFHLNILQKTTSKVTNSPATNFPNQFASLSFGTAGGATSAGLNSGATDFHLRLAMGSVEHNAATSGTTVVAEMRYLDASVSTTKFVSGRTLQVELNRVDSIRLVSFIPTRTGDVCDLVDVWTCPDYWADGDNANAAGSRNHICFGNLLFPWDGSLRVLV